MWIAPVYGGEKTVIKFATLAPEGSSWMEEMHRLAQEVEKGTGGAVSFKFYAGGVSGDEKDVIRKMRVGQLHGAGFTGVGLGEILPEVRVLDLPFLFETDGQIQNVYHKLNGHFSRRFEEEGYILLGWVPVGWVHFFSAQEIPSVEALRATKPWMWEGDPLVREAYQAMQVNPVPLSVTDVLMSLQTGLLDTVYSSPQGALALQWFTKVKYMSRLRMGYATGGVLITRRQFEKLSPEHQKVLREVSEKCLGDLVRLIQKENDKSIEVMQKNGVVLSPEPPSGEIAKFRQAGEVARKKLVGTLFSRELLETTLSYLKEVK
ncbi:MAG: ABC transporter substrate-binding protein [Nitrospinae bacterium CG11_big_fil_rev_8_21_14_0_20_56_8]|nr:MAG: ABC transporter substrate-binding protein [Nitrospinae bacterium CG11_big_fil_rev_8_21_14_0_20_56_8]